MPVHGSVRRPACERRVSLHDLEELGQQEDRSEHTERHQHRGEVGGREGPLAEEAHRHHRSLSTGAPTTRRRRAAPRPATSGTMTPRLVHPCALPRTRPHTRPNSPALASAKPGRSSARLGPVVSVRRHQAMGSEHETDGHVQPEDPLPREPFDHRAADHGADGDRQTGHAAPHAQCEPAPRRRDGRREDGQGQRRDDRLPRRPGARGRRSATRCSAPRRRAPSRP